MLDILVQDLRALLVIQHTKIF